MVEVHDDVAEPTELGAAERLGEEVPYHLVGGTVHELDMISLDDVRHEK